MNWVEEIGVEQIGFWAPGYPDVETWLRETPDPSVQKPECAVVPGRSKRGTSRIMRMLAEVATQAAKGASLSETPIVFASAWGEIETMVELLDQIAKGSEGLSPLRFKNSVHNAASGLLSIAAQNRAFSTALAAGMETAECGFVEAISTLVRFEEVILAIGDDSLPEPLDRYADFEGLAVAFRLSKKPSQSALGTLKKPTWAGSPNPKNGRLNPTVDALDFARGILQQQKSLAVGRLSFQAEYGDAHQRNNP